MDIVTRLERIESVVERLEKVLLGTNSFSRNIVTRRNQDADPYSTNRTPSAPLREGTTAGNIKFYESNTPAPPPPPGVRTPCPRKRWTRRTVR